MKINLFYLINNLCIGGAEKLLLSIIKQMDKNRFNIHVCHLLKERNELLNEYQKYATVHSLGLNHFKQYYKIYNLIALLDYVKPDIVHTHLCESDLFGQLSKLFYRKPLLFSTLHSTDEWKKGKRIKSWIRIQLEKRTIRQCEKIIAVSEPVRTFAMKYQKVPENKIITIENGVEIHEPAEEHIQSKIRTEFNLAEDDIIIGTVARLEPPKALHVLIDAFYYINELYSNTKLFLIGDGSQRLLLENQIEEKNLRNQVYITGYRNDVNTLLSGMDIYASSSIIEGLPVSILEAMAHSLPVVASAAGGIPDIIGNDENGLCVPVNDSQALATALERLIRSNEMRNHYKTKARQKAEKDYNILNMVKKYESLYVNSLKQMYLD